MTTRNLILEGLEQAIGGVIALDPETAQRLAALHGKVIRLDLDGTGLRFHFVPTHEGRVRLLYQIEGEPDATLSGSPLDLVRASDPGQGPAQLFAGRVRITGNSDLGRRFSQALAGLDIDWEEQLARYTGDVAAHEIGRGVRLLLNEAQRLRRDGGERTSEYLTEEARLLPHRYEVEDFLGDVDRLRDDIDRLEARIGILEKRGKDRP